MKSKAMPNVQILVLLVIIFLVYKKVINRENFEDDNLGWFDANKYWPD